MVGSPDAYAKYCSQLRAAPSDAVSQNSHGSADLGALVSAGPCINHDNLRTIKQFHEMSNLFQPVASDADVQGIWEQINSVSRHLLELASSYKVATSELQSARESATASSCGASGVAARTKAKAKAKRVCPWSESCYRSADGSSRFGAWAA